MFTITYRDILVDTVADFQTTLNIVHDLNLDDDYVSIQFQGMECSTFDLAIAGLFIAAQEADDLVLPFMRLIELNIKGNTIDLAQDEYWLSAEIVAAFGKPTNCSYNTHDGLIWHS